MIKKIQTINIRKKDKCPICGSVKYQYCDYSEDCWGACITVERHGSCGRCGYIVEQAYSDVFEAFQDIKKGFVNHKGKYVPKDIRKHKRIRRKMNAENIPVNPAWLWYI